jgi:Domain of unknown function (DUF4105)
MQTPLTMLMRICANYRQLFLLLMFCLVSNLAHAQTDLAQPPVNLRAGVMTIEPGEEFWARFGHDAIIIENISTGASISYNFGYFDMSEPGFFSNFMNGRMQYQLVVIPTDEDIAHYENLGRGVKVQWLNLNQAQILSLYKTLDENAKPENSRYTYDYYTSNCATRVRDAIDSVLDGQLQSQLSGRSMGNTYRSESVRLAWPAKWMAMGFHLGLGPAADAPLSRWQEAFIPMRLRDSLREVKLANGRPLVHSEAELVKHRLSLPPAEIPLWKKQAFFIGLITAIAILWLAKRWPRLTAALASVFWLISGLLGCLMLFVWFGSAHWAGYKNANVLLLSPLCLALLPGAWHLISAKSTGAFFNVVLWAVAASAALAAFLNFLPFLAQENFQWVLMLLPIHLALAKSLSKPAE